MKNFDTGRVVLAVTLIVAGVILLAVRRFGGAAESLWPFFIIIPGVALTALAVTGGWQSKVAAAAGGVITGVGLILLVQDITDYYQSWAYAWTLLPACAGAALYALGRQTDDDNARTTGRGLIQWGAVAFVVFAVGFEALIFHGRAIIGGWLVPIVLIAAGALLLVRPGSLGIGGSKREPPADEPPAPRE